MAQTITNAIKLGKTQTHTSLQASEVGKTTTARLIAKRLIVRKIQIKH